MRVLGIESSSLVASVALVTDDILTAEYTVDFKKTHSQTLLPMLDEIVKLVGMDALSAPDRLKLEAARSIREDFLHQDAFHEVDTFTSLKKQHMMMMLVLAYYDQAGEALNKGVNIERLVNLPVRETIGRFKYTPEGELDKAYDNILDTLRIEIGDELSRKEDF